jgi:hypothetical protein
MMKYVATSQRAWPEQITVVASLSTGSGLQSAMPRDLVFDPTAGTHLAGWSVSWALELSFSALERPDYVAAVQNYAEQAEGFYRKFRGVPNEFGIVSSSA